MFQKIRKSHHKNSKTMSKKYSKNKNKKSLVYLDLSF